MVCCCMPCFHKLQERFDPVPGSGPFTLCFSESVRWICIIVPIYLSAWRFGVLMDIPLDAAFWGILTGTLLGFSLLIYLPLKIVALRYRMKKNQLKDYRWRPSIVTYILICALPCLTLIIVAIEVQMDTDCATGVCTLDPTTTAVLQVTILGLTITEWMSKIREEHITYDLITAMALDFFFAYDCIQFIMMCTYDTNIYQSGWVYVCFIFAFVAMFRYIPGQPVGVKDKGSSIGAAVCITVSMLTVDIPFIIVRVCTMVEFGLVVSDIIHPLKNFAMICFGCTQLYIIYETRKKINKLRRKSEHDLTVSIKRRSKHPGIWDLDRAHECVKNAEGNCECDDTGSNHGYENHTDVWPEDQQGHENHAAEVPNNTGGSKKYAEEKKKSTKKGVSLKHRKKEDKSDEIENDMELSDMEE